jgi:hypothetical protein
MKTLLLTAILLIPLFNVNAQGIGELAPPKPLEKFPPHAYGLDIIFSEGGFGLGTFYRLKLSDEVTAFTDFSISEAKDPREFTYVDYYGNTFTPDKINRAFLLPINIGIHYRLFENTIYDNLRPYLDLGVGPTIVITDPATAEYFSAFRQATTYIAPGGYVGIGANFGLDKSSLVGVNVRYYLAHLLNGGVEIMQGRLENDLGGVFITINIGVMY